MNLFYVSFLDIGETGNSAFSKLEVHPEVQFLSINLLQRKMGQEEQIPLSISFSSTGITIYPNQPAFHDADATQNWLLRRREEIFKAKGLYSSSIG